MEKNLQDLLKLLPDAEVTGAAGKTITDITADSRVVVPGSLFICLKGATVDGHKFLQQAHEKGAVAAIVEDAVICPEGMTLIKVNDTRRAMELVTPYFFDYPGKKMRMIGVTGTNGKTTTTNIIRLILRKAGYKVGMIGTINIMIEDEETVSHNTTPDVVDLQKTLYKMQQCGCDYVVMEVSSHALALKRVAGIEYDTAVLTNITQDHLDFHKTFENYRDAKSLLFEHLAGGTKEGKTAVLNMDDPSSKIIAARTKVPVITYGESKDYDIYPISFDVQAKQMALKLHTPACEMDLVLKITGEFNVYNVMSAVGAMLAEKIDPQIIMDVLDGFDGFFFHSSCLELDGEGYVFSAVSGTGKSTHTALWRRHFGNRVTMINDDKPVIRKCDGKFYAYGTPWMGKADIGTNTKAPVKAVYILQRAEENTAVRVLPSQVMKQLLEATVIDVERSRMEKLLELLDEFFKETPLFLLGCNMDESAVMTAYNAANGG